jgi:hypothetical protein
VPTRSSPVWPNSVAVIGGCVATGDGMGVEGGVIGFEGGVVVGAGIGAGAGADVVGNTGVGAGGVGAGAGFTGAVGVGVGAGTAAGAAGGDDTTGAGAGAGCGDGAAAGGAGDEGGQENKRARRKPQLLGFVAFCPSAARPVPAKLRPSSTASTMASIVLKTSLLFTINSFYCLPVA